MSKAKQIVRWSVIPLSVLLLLGMVVAGCGSKSSSISDLVKKSEDASRNIVSIHQEEQLNYITDIGSGTMSSQVVDVSGSNVKALHAEFGTTILEKVLYNGRQWSKTFPENVWVEDKNVTLNPSTATSGDVSKYDTLPTNSKSQKELPKEVVSGYTCYHLQFELTQENVKEIFTQVPQENLVNNTGGTVDLWIDETNYYLIKLEGNFDNIKIADVASLSNVKMQIIIVSTQINQPISIAPPI